MLQDEYHFSRRVWLELARNRFSKRQSSASFCRRRLYGMWLSSSSMLHEVTVLLQTCELRVECLDASEGDNIEYEMLAALVNHIYTDPYRARLALSLRID